MALLSGGRRSVGNTCETTSIKTPEQEASLISPMPWGNRCTGRSYTLPTSELELALPPVTSSLEGVRG
jgi:hypothetical protein